MKLRRNTKIRLVVGFFFQTILFMALAPLGSFNPQDVGFWTSILGATITTTLLYFGFKKYAKYEE